MSIQYGQRGMWHFFFSQQKEKDMTSRKIIALLTIAALIFLGAATPWADEPSRVAIIPFKVNADQDLSFLRDGIVDMLTTRLSWEDKVIVIQRETTESAVNKAAGPINEKVARQVGASLGANYVLFGSLTVFGQSVSIDAKMIDVHGIKPAVTFFDQSQGMDTVIPKINLFAEDINEKTFGRVLTRPSQAPARAVRSQGPPDIYAHPEKLLGGADARYEKTSGLNPDFVLAAGQRESSSFWKSRNFENNIKAMAVGDVDGDGKQEVVFISQNQVLVYRNLDRRFTKVKEVPGKPNYSFVSVDVADINQNGKAEIFVTNLNTVKDSLDSFVLEWIDGDFVHISKDNNWYYRVLDLPGRGTALLAQKRGISDAFLPGIHELAWRNGDYESVDTLVIPKKVNVFGFAMGDVMNEGNEMVLVFDEDDYLHILTKSGSKEWKSDEHYGGSVNYLDTDSKTEASEKDRLYLGQRIFIRDLDRDGKNEVIVVKNKGTGSRLFKRFRNYSSGEIVSLLWDGLGLALNWKTRKIHGYVSDFAIADFDNDGEEEIVAAVVMSKGASFVVKPKSAIISYDLTIPEAQENQ